MSSRLWHGAEAAVGRVAGQAAGPVEDRKPAHPNLDEVVAVALRRDLQTQGAVPPAACAADNRRH